MQVCTGQGPRLDLDMAAPTIGTILTLKRIQTGSSFPIYGIYN